MTRFLRTNRNRNLVAKIGAASALILISIGQLTEAEAASCGLSATDNNFTINTVGGAISGSADINVACGVGANATGGSATAVGNIARATGAQATAVGSDARATKNGSTAIGSLSRATGKDSTAIGIFAVADSDHSVSVGHTTGQASGPQAIQIGAFAGYQTGNYAIAIGAGWQQFTGAAARGPLSVAIGSGDNGNVNGVALSAASAEGLLGIAIGTASVANGAGGTTVGWGSMANGLDSTAFGSNAQANAANSIAIGGYGFPGAGKGAFVASDAVAAIAIGTRAQISAGASNAVAIGLGAKATRKQAIAIGDGSVANKANTVSVGSKSIKRRIVNVAPGVGANDAVTVAQMQAAVAAVASGTSPAKVAVPAALEPPAVSVVQVGPGSVGHIIDNMRQELSELRALVRQQQQRIAQLESHVLAAAK